MGKYTLETWSVADLPARDRLLFFSDPRHVNHVGRWHLILKSDSLLVEVPTTDLRIPLFTFPPKEGLSEWFQLEPGLRSQVSYPEDIEVPAGKFEDCVHLSFEADSLFLSRLHMYSDERPMLLECWIAPFEGPVCLKSKGSIEELEERY